MPCIGLICKHETPKKVSFDHFDRCRSRNQGRAAYPPWAASYEAAKIQKDIRHSDLRLTATGCLGCPRARIITATQDYYLDPEKAFVRTRGTACHEIAARALNAEAWISEATDPMRMVVRGRLWAGAFDDCDAEPVVGWGPLVTSEGVMVEAQLDAIKRDMSEIVDWKFPRDMGAKFRDKMGRAKDDYAVQLNIQRLLLARQEWAQEAGLDPEAVLLTSWDHASMGKTGPAPLRAEIIDEERLLEHTVAGDSGGVWKVGDIVATHIDMVRRWGELGGPKADPAKVRALCAGTSCLGREKFRGQGCSAYCDAHMVSQELTREFGEPEPSRDE